MAWGIGLVVGPSLGGLIGQTNLRLPAFFAAGLSLLNLALGFLILPESLPKERRESTPIQPQQVNHL
jgi:DHA1 family tetracycline resistance protein-like MFS transporter